METTLHKKSDTKSNKYTSKRRTCLYRTEPIMKSDLQYKIKTQDTHTSINSLFDNLNRVVEESKKLLDLEEDWDDDGALICKPEVYKNAVDLLIVYTKFIYTTYLINIKDPEINLCKDGSIDIEWRDRNYICLLNIQNEDDFLVHYFAEEFISKTIIKGFLNSKTVNEDLAFWMKKMK